MLVVKFVTSISNVPGVRSNCSMIKSYILKLTGLRVKRVLNLRLSDHPGNSSWLVHITIWSKFTALSELDLVFIVGVV